MNINIRIRNLLYASFAIVLIWFLYTVRSVLIPFVLAGIFAYIFNPLITFFNRKFNIPRSVSIFIVYLLLIATVALLTIFLTRAVIGESDDIAITFNQFFLSARNEINHLPIWLQPTARDYFGFLSKNQSNIISVSPFPLFSRALTGVLSIFVTLFAAFFFLKDNRSMVDRLHNFIPHEYREDSKLLLRRINTVLSSYLRGQIILIISMVIMLFFSFLVLGVKYALTISVASALFEIVPVMGPIFAAILGIFIILISGGSGNFPLNPYQSVIVIAAIYYVTRQIQDYVISPYVIGKATKLHPLVILFSVLAGQHLYGVVGVLLAVPVAATFKIIYQFVIDRIRDEDSKKSSKI